MRLARLWRPGIVSAFHPLSDEPDTAPLLTALAEEGFATALPVVVGRGLAACVSPLAAGRANPRRRNGDPRAPRRRRQPSIRIFCLCRSPASTGGAPASAMARASTTGASLGLRAIKPIHAIGVAYGVCEVAAVPYEAHDQSLDAVVTEQETILFNAQ